MIIPRIKPITDKRLQQLERNSSSMKYRIWRDSVIARDGGKCQYPGCQDTKPLQVHHIRRFADVKHLRYEQFNGITLCAKHHQAIANNEQFYEMTFFKIAKANFDALERKKNEDIAGHSGTKST